MFSALSEDTIAAPITGAAHAAVSVLRISGPRTREVLSALTPKAPALFACPRRAILSPLLAPGTATATVDVIDHSLFCFFEGPHSYTGEDSAEISLHGSPYLIRKLMACLQQLGVRPAGPGEFTQRAFFNGRLDLVQAEAVADLVAAETESQARAAREQLEGKLSSSVAEFGDPMRELLAEIEAQIDFSDEELDLTPYLGWQERLISVRGKLQRAIDSYEKGKIVREGAKIVLAGLPNAGKSSLLNALLREERAIVTPLAGTTRDTIIERLSLRGLYVLVTDTAGVYPDEKEEKFLGDVERIGVGRSWNLISDADIVVFVFAFDLPLEPQLAAFQRVLGRARRLVAVVNKVDLGDKVFSDSSLENLADKPLLISASTSINIDAFEEALVAQLGLDETFEQWTVLVTNERHHRSLSAAKERVEAAYSLVSKEAPLDLIAFELRSALHGISEIVGVTATEDILGHIFSRFCIGK